MDFQIIQSGKARAIARIIEAVIAIFLVTSLPSAAKLARDIAGKSLSLLYGYLRNPLANFIIFNAIIIVLVLLSRQKPISVEDPKPKNFDIFEILSQVVAEEREKRMVVEEREIREIRRFERTQSVNLKRENESCQHILSRQQLRRSETNIGKNKKVEKAREISVVDKVDMLSSEEFQRTIEEFIAKQQRFLLAQKMAELE